MKTDNYRVIGLMSGTSLDGLDLCCAEFSILKNQHWKYEILAAETAAYEQNWENQLRSAATLSSQDLLALHSEYGFYLGKKVQHFIRKNKLENLDLIASHGHTIFHQPERKFTFQLGDGRAIKSVTGLRTVYDFRSENVLLGGQGAPLVPLGDRILFPEFDACLNLGGFSNISLEHRGKRIAFDISPVNIVLNKLSQKLGQPFDAGGEMARSGKICEDSLAYLNALAFYQQKYPKSLGAEWLDHNIWPLISHLGVADALHTFTAHTADQIAKVLNDFKMKNVLVTGGGAYNTYLIKLIQTKTAAQLIIPEHSLINFKEALIFAFLGLRAFRGEINILASATGCAEDHTGGLIV